MVSNFELKQIIKVVTLPILNKHFYKQLKLKVK